MGAVLLYLLLVFIAVGVGALAVVACCLLLDAIKKRVPHHARGRR